VSITAHANDIFAHPRNLAEKLAAARFTTSGCRYTVEALRDIAGPAHADRVHEVIMGVDPEEFARRTPHPSQRTVLAVGRLVAKKGFEDLLEAVALLRDRGVAPQRTVVVGEGPQRERLAELVAELDLKSLVELAGPLDRAGRAFVSEHCHVDARPSGWSS
jgi:glycosyltransferase involved in cell wall biosynthesis